MPKLLDFGIAKPLTRSGIDTSDPTRPMLRRATPAYASPEQLQGLAAHTSMDVFSLGVVLHEIITGHRPWPVEPDEVTGTGAGRYLKPSAGLAKRLKESGTNARTWSGYAVFVVKPRDIEGDLDAIVLKAMHDDTHRRYASVDLLLRDLQAYLAGNPVSARPTSTSLRISKFLRRNPMLSTAILVAVVALVVAAATVARLWFVAARDRDRANAQVDNLKTLATATFAIDKSLADLRAPRYRAVSWSAQSAAISHRCRLATTRPLPLRPPRATGGWATFKVIPTSRISATRQQPSAATRQRSRCSNRSVALGSALKRSQWQWRQLTPRSPMCSRHSGHSGRPVHTTRRR